MAAGLGKDEEKAALRDGLWLRRGAFSMRLWLWDTPAWEGKAGGTLLRQGVAPSREGSCQHCKIVLLCRAIPFLHGIWRIVV